MSLLYIHLIGPQQELQRKDSSPRNDLIHLRLWGTMYEDILLLL